jgi:hypothetical protein
MPESDPENRFCLTPSRRHAIQCFLGTLAAAATTFGRASEPAAHSATAASQPVAASAVPGDQSSGGKPAINNAEANRALEAGERLREGTKLIDVVGAFDFSGERAAFHPDGSRDSFRVLENLALERISRILSEGRGPRQWTVSGLITEFRGTNYLLVQKAVIRTDDLHRPAP